MNSRSKGARGEREWRDVLRKHGHTARRGQQFAGSPDSPDVVCETLPWAHWEVKRVERLNIEDAMAQAVRDCGKAPSVAQEARDTVVKVPVLAHRRNGKEWLVTMRADDWFAKISQSGRKEA